MLGMTKLLFLIGGNLLALIWLVWKLTNLGLKFPEALKAAWELVILQNEPRQQGINNTKITWAAVLGKTWWLMLIVFCINWVNNQLMVHTMILGCLLLFHGVWYWLGYKGLALESYNRVLSLSPLWGIVFHEIALGSPLASQSLAELDLRKKNLLVMAVEREKQVTPFPKGLEVLNPGDRLIMFGDLSSYRSIFGSY